MSWSYHSVLTQAKKHTQKSELPALIFFHVTVTITKQFCFALSLCMVFVFLLFLILLLIGGLRITKSGLYYFSQKFTEGFNLGCIFKVRNNIFFKKVSSDLPSNLFLVMLLKTSTSTSKWY